MFNQVAFLKFDIKDPERQMVKAIKAGNNEAITYLYHQYSTKLMTVCRRYASDTDTAKDIFQEGFLKIISVIDSYRFESKFESWLNKIMVNHCINFIRKRKKDIKWVTLSDLHFNYSDESNEILEPNLKVSDILEIMDQLPYGYKLVLNMYAVDNMTHREIANMLGISESTSKSQLFKARRALIGLIKLKAK